MKKLIKENAWSFYLGFILGIVGIKIFSWQYWTIMLPTIILVVISQTDYDSTKTK